MVLFLNGGSENVHLQPKREVEVRVTFNMGSVEMKVYSINDAP